MMINYVLIVFSPLHLKKGIPQIQLSASYHGLHQEIDSDGRFKTKPYDKRDDFDFPILTFLCIYNNTPVVPTYLVHIDVIHLYICQLIRGPISISLTEDS